MIRCTKKDKGYYSAHFVSLQVDFVKGQESIVKDLIRLVKYWRKTCIEDKSNGTTRLPSSYPLELITIDCWEKAEKPLSFDIRAGFKAVLQQLVDNCHIQVIWYDNYKEAIAERASGIKGMKSKRFVCFPVQGILQAKSRSLGEDAHIKVMGVIMVPPRVLKSRMTTGRVITAAITVLGTNLWGEPFASQILSYSLLLLRNGENITKHQ